MESFNGKTFRELGLVVMSMQGVLDMPKRNGATYYDWGNKYEPLVDVDDIYFGVREINMDVLFDVRLGADWETTMNFLESSTEEADLTTAYGTQRVRLNSSNMQDIYKGGFKVFELTFFEMNPDLSGALPTVTGNDAAIRIDGYDLFATFGFLIEKVDLFGIEKLKVTEETRYKRNKLSIYRQPQEIEVKINGIYANKTDMAEKVSAFNSLLAKDGLRHFVYRNYGFQCFNDEGCTVVLYRHRVELTIKLKVMAYYNYEEIVQDVIDRVHIETNPQSDLSVTDPASAAFIKGKDTFVAADSQKLGGNLPATFAKEDEIAALRSADLAADLEAATPNV